MGRGEGRCQYSVKERRVLVMTYLKSIPYEGEKGSRVK